jgi:hypothetical protein
LITKNATRGAKAAARSGQIYAFVMRRPQMFHDGSNHAAIQLHFALSIEKLAERFVQLALKRSDLLLDAAEAPFDITFNIAAQAIFQLCADHSFFLRAGIFKAFMVSILSGQNAYN